MSPPIVEDPIRFPRAAFWAGLIVLVGGIVLAVAGAQVLMLVHVRGPWAAAPWALIALGLLAVPAGGALTNARVWACFASAALAGSGALLSLVWGVYALANGLFTLTPFFGAPLAGLGAALAISVLRPVRVYARAREALFAEDGPASPLLEPGVPARSGPPWPQIVAGGGALSVGAAVLLVLLAPERAERVLSQLHLLATLRLPPSADAFAPTRADYPYPSSPFLDYLDYERTFVDFDRARAAAFADALAEDVGWRMLRETGARDISSAERALWERGEARAIPLWIADSLRGRGVFYHPESLLSRSFDPALHDEEGRVHLDCDQLAHLFAHVAWRLDLRLWELQSPLHVYVRLDPPSGLDADPITVETTNFRRVDVLGNQVDYLGAGVGEAFLIDEDYHPSGRGGTWAAPELVAAAGLYQPASARDIADMIVANVVVGLHDHGASAPLLDELRGRLEGTRSYVLVSNLHTWTLEAAREALAAGDAAAALQLAEQAIAVREGAPDLVLSQDADDRILAARARAALDDRAGARAALELALARYRERFGEEDPPVARTASEAEVLALLAELDPPRDARACEASVGAVLRHEAGLDAGERRWSELACAAARASPRACAGLLADCGG